VTLSERLLPIRKRTEENANLRSDDFDHSTDDLLLAESGHLQTAARDIEKLIQIIDIMEKALTANLNCMVDGKYETVKAEGVIAGVITRADIALQKALEVLE
jgi:hypothetical protein